MWFSAFFANLNDVNNSDHDAGGTHAFGLMPTSDPAHWVMELGDLNVTPGGSMQGGVGLGVAVDALEVITGRPAVWATAQYLRYASPPGRVDIRLTQAVVGHKMTQARAVVTMGSAEVLTALVALGSREFPIEGQKIERPVAKSPAESEYISMAREDAYAMFSNWPLHMARGRTKETALGEPGKGDCIFYVKVAGGPRLVTASDIAMVGDMMPMAYGDAFGAFVNGNSIDNTIRFGDRTVSEWIMLDCSVFDLRHGYAHGMAHMWADDGTYLGTATQSSIMRNYGDDGGLKRGAPKMQAG